MQPQPARLEIAQSVVKGGRAGRCTAEVTLSQSGPASSSSPLLLPLPIPRHAQLGGSGVQPLAIRRNTQRPISPIFCQSGEKKRRRDARPTLFTFLSFVLVKCAELSSAKTSFHTPQRSSSNPTAMDRERILAARTIEGMIAEGHTIIIFEDYVLRLDSWLAKHPGGQLAVLHMVGKDATDEITVYVSYPS